MRHSGFLNESAIRRIVRSSAAKLMRESAYNPNFINTDEDEDEEGGMADNILSDFRRGRMNNVRRIWQDIDDENEKNDIFRFIVDNCRQTEAYDYLIFLASIS